MQSDRPWLPSVPVLAVAVLCLSTPSTAATPGSDAPTKPSKHEPAGAAATPEPADPAARPPTIKETLAAVGQISHELKLIDERLGRMEESVLHAALRRWSQSSSK